MWHIPTYLINNMYYIHTYIGICICFEWVLYRPLQSVLQDVNQTYLYRCKFVKQLRAEYVGRYY